MPADQEIYFLTRSRSGCWPRPRSVIECGPRTLQEFSGQRHVLGEGKLLTRAIESDRLSSVILYGPPGVGKTTLATCISQQTQQPFIRINAVSSNVEELRRILAGALNRRRATGQKTVLFIDEIHRFNKGQQDVLMPDLEEGHVILIGGHGL